MPLSVFGRCDAARFTLFAALNVHDGAVIALIAQRAIRRGSFDSTAELVKKIDHSLRTHNANSCPFVWTATADPILQKLARLCQRISGTEH